MKPELITKSTYDARVLPWWTRAVNDPATRRFLSLDTWREPPKLADGDWSSAIFMSPDDAGLMTISMDRERRELCIGLWVVGGNPLPAALLMRFATQTLMRRYGCSFATFAIADHNTAWRNAALRRLRDFRWGVEPSAAWDESREEWTGLHRFRVPRSALLTTSRRARQEARS